MGKKENEFVAVCLLNKQALKKKFLLPHPAQYIFQNTFCLNEFDQIKFNKIVQIK